MPLPTPHPGLVISYSYLWQDEHHRGAEEGRKNRPCAIVVAQQLVDGVCIVSAVPITHTPPADAVDAIAIPPGLKRHLGLDDDPSWIVVSELNQFIWPGPDLRPVPGKPDRYDYGVLPPSFFRILREAIFEHIRAKNLRVVHRTV